MKLRKHKIVLIGAGNVATQLGLAFKEKGFCIEQVYSRTLESAKELGLLLNTQYTTDLNDLVTDADIYIFSVKDSVLPDLLKQLPSLQGLLLHTAGSIPLTVFETTQFPRHGVFYPLQTFSKARKVSFEEIPIFVEANNKEDEDLLEELASELSKTAIRLSSEKREYLHLAAVFACNFANHMYVCATDILEKEGLSKNYLLPLIEETATKIKDMSPLKAQTGPAIRYDVNVINHHLRLLEDNLQKKELYELISKSIHESAKS
ncbi:DUF2520 domain-containing protein [Bacteroidales bacterium OttesenSCG-928-M06]|nr:DUF2520 domain-containing protein [Bacteroidales bacterium OttesenSCG-928-M06]